MAKKPEGLATVIMAAGMGTRMKSDLPKVLHELAGIPLICFPVDLALKLQSKKVVAVVGHQHKKVEAALGQMYKSKKLETALQRPQLGTGHAVQKAQKALKDHHGLVLILSGDVPFLSSDTVRDLMKLVKKKKLPLGMVTARLHDPTGYGRITRDDEGHVTGVVEHRDATKEQLFIDEINAGIYIAEADFLFKSLKKLKTDNDQGEYYLTDIIAMAAEQAGDVATVEGDELEVAGINSREQLSEMESIFRDWINEEWMNEGVTMHGPETIRIDPSAEIGPNTELYPGVELRGNTHVGAGCKIETGSILENCRLEDNVHVKPYSVLEDSTFQTGAIIGPFAHVRPGSNIGKDCHIGNFVELKKTNMDVGAKANHLSYLGDADIGKRTNVGAGTITCNYDGEGKYRTEIGDDVFIGSDTQLVAPVKLGAKSFIAAGTTVYEDVPAGALALTRPEQTTVKGWGSKKFAKILERRKAKAAKKKAKK